MTRQAGAPPRRAVAKRPPGRTVEATIEKGLYAGWWARARADFPASVLADMQSGKIEGVIRALDVIVVEHNMPNSDDKVAERMGDVDPYDGLLEMAQAVFDAIGSLPNR